MIKQTGIGTYIQNTLPYILKSNKIEVYLLVNKANLSFINSLLLKNEISIPKDRFIIAKSKWYSFAEQLEIPFLLSKYPIDVFHVPNFNIPLLYFKKYVVTLHDTTHFEVNKNFKSTLNPILYFFKKIGLSITKSKIKRSKKIVTVSNTSKRKILDIFNISTPEKNIVEVIPNGLSLDSSYLENNENVFSEKLIANKYILYVGRAYPHKNLSFLLHNIKSFLKDNNFKLVLAGYKDKYYLNIEKEVENLNMQNLVIFQYNKENSYLYNLYHYCEFVILPSKKEGFGLQILEGMYFNKNILASDIPSYKEVGGNVIEYFSLNNTSDFKNSLKKMLKLKDSKESKYKNILNKYSYKENSNLLIDIYLKS